MSKQPAAGPSEPGVLHAERRRWLVFVLVVASVYAAAIVYMGGLRFDLVKDEEQFWEQSTEFARDWPPSLVALRSYDEPMTPLSFLMWGGLENLHHGGVAAARLFTLFGSLVVLALIAFQRPRAGVPPETPWLAATSLMIYPYWLPSSLLVYTDVPATAFVVCGFFFYTRDRHVLSALGFALAIATRQYMVVFPTAIAAYELLGALRSRRPAWRRWLPQLAAVASLLGWIAFFGGLGPAPGLAKWPRHSDAISQLVPAYAIYALSAIGAYFVLVEFLIDRGWRRLSLRIDRRTAAWFVVAILLFALFTPYYPDKVGLLNRTFDMLLGSTGIGQVIRIVLLLGLLLATAARFARFSLGTSIVLANVAIMPFLWTAWEKYYMPMLAALWFLKAYGSIDAPPASTSPPGERVR